MKLFCCYTPAHAVLFERYFRPSVPEGFVLESAQLDIDGRGDFLSREFLECIKRKMHLVTGSLIENDGRIIAWSDVDIQFVDTTPRGLEEAIGNQDIVFQREGKSTRDVNTGFFVCKSSERIVSLFRKVTAILLENRGVNEQYAVNELLQSGQAAVAWGYLPLEYYARTHGWPPPRKLALYHANDTAGPGGVERKIKQFKELAFVRRFGWPGLLITCLKYAPRRLCRVLGKKGNSHLAASRPSARLR